MLKKIMPMIYFIIFIMSQACTASVQSSDQPDYDQIGRFHLATILCHMAETKQQLSIQDFIGTTLIGPSWRSILPTYIQTTQTYLSWPEQALHAARTKAYCDLHYQARIADRQDVINFIQHGQLLSNQISHKTTPSAIS